MKLKSIKQLKNLKNKKVLYRVDYNLPLIQKGKKLVAPSDHLRLTATVSTIKYLLKNNCGVVLMSWLGRPEGERIEKYSLQPVAIALADVLNKEVSFVDDCAGKEVEDIIINLKPKEVLVLENVRFRPEEANGDKNFAKELVKGFDLIVFDAFAQSHRDCPSVTGIMKQLPSYAGLLLESEVSNLEKVTKNPKKPLTMILGGAKISDKINVMKKLVKQADNVLIGGGLANIFLKAEGVEVANSYIENPKQVEKTKTNIDYLKEVKNILKNNKNIILPIDLIATDDISKPTKTKLVDLTLGQKIPDGWMFADIGPKTVKYYREIINQSKTILWNGPMGIFENAKFSKGTEGVALAVAKSKTISVIGGGDTELIVRKFKLQGKFTHVSTGGGAMLKFLEGEMLPGIKGVIVK